MQAVSQLKTKDMSYEAWKNERRKGIGGSDAAAILGLNPYISRYSAWADKMGFLPEKEDSESMRQGRDLEAYVAERFSLDTGKRVRKKNAILRSAAHPFMLANIDREVVGESAGLECKTTSTLNMKKFKNGNFPDAYYCQCVHYLAVTGWSKWYLAVLVLGQDFIIFEITRDEDEINALIDAESEFWSSVVSGTPPIVDGSRPTSYAMDIIGGHQAPAEYDLSESISEFRRLELVNAQIRSLESEAVRIKQSIKSKMGGIGRGVCGNYQAVWNSYDRATVDLELLLKYCPKQILSKVIKARRCKSFRVRKDIEHAAY